MRDMFKSVDGETYSQKMSNKRKHDDVKGVYLVGFIVLKIIPNIKKLLKINNQSSLNHFQK